MCFMRIGFFYNHFRIDFLLKNFNFYLNMNTRFLGTDSVIQKMEQSCELKNLRNRRVRPKKQIK